MNRFRFIFDTRNSSSVVKALLVHQMATCPNSRGGRALGHFFPTCLLKPLNPFIGYEAIYNTLSSVLSSPINNLCQLCNVWTKYVDLWYFMDSTLPSVFVRGLLSVRHSLSMYMLCTLGNNIAVVLGQRRADTIYAQLKIILVNIIFRLLLHYWYCSDI